MFKTDLVNKKKNNNVTFSFKSTEARKVILIGDFNSWNPQKHPMKKNGTKCGGTVHGKKP
jgi:1,4-alpha-glucan branching enzyme